MEKSSRIPELVEALRSEDESVRKNAVIELGKSGVAAKDAVGALIEALSDESDDVRSNAARALGEIGDSSAVSTLEELSRSDREDFFVRIAATNALKRIETPEGSQRDKEKQHEANSHENVVSKTAVSIRKAAISQQSEKFPVGLSISVSLILLLLGGVITYYTNEAKEIAGRIGLSNRGVDSNQGKLDELAEVFALQDIGTPEAMKAVEEYKKKHGIIEIRSFNPSALHAQGKLDEAIAAWKMLISSNPNLAEAHNGLGATYYSQGKLNEAIAEFKAAIHINPNLAMAHRNLGLTYAKQGKSDLAIAEWEKAIEINPNHANAHSNLGNAHASQGNNKQAITHYKEFIRLARTNPALRSRISEVERHIRELK